jgi:hypothetical protein
MLLAQVNASEPEGVFHDKHKLDTTFGTVYPIDRRFDVSPGVSPRNSGQKPITKPSIPGLYNRCVPHR